MSKTTKKSKPTYRYIIENSILYGYDDEYQFSILEYNILHNFFITYSMCKNSSLKKKTFVDYGWFSINITESGCLEKLNLILDLDKNKNFIFFNDENLKEQFDKLNLSDIKTSDITTERAVIVKTNDENNYFRLFRRIRNSLAHGNYRLIFSDENEIMVIMQDHYGKNVTARIVIKLDTIWNIIKIIDKNMIYSEGD